MDTLSGDIPPLVFQLSPINEPGEVTLDKEMLSVIRELDGKKTIDMVAMQQDMREAFKTLTDTGVFTYMLLEVTAFVVILIAWFLGRAIGTPIKKLTEVAERISVGDLGAEIKIKSRDEIGNPAEAILRMQDSLRLAIERLRLRQ